MFWLACATVLGSTVTIISYIVTCTLYADIKDDNGHSLLEIALMSDKFHHIKDCIDVAIYLVNTGCGNEQDISDLFCRACQTKRRDVLAQLVAEHKIDPNSELSLRV